MESAEAAEVAISRRRRGRRAHSARADGARTNAEKAISEVGAKNGDLRLMAMNSGALDALEDGDWTPKMEMCTRERQTAKQNWNSRRTRMDMNGSEPEHGMFGRILLKELEGGISSF